MSAVKLGSAEYLEHIAAEKAEYSRLYEDDEAKEGLIEPCPAVWTAVENRVERLQVERTGRTLDDHIVAMLDEQGGRRMLSLGCGPGGVELVYARRSPGAFIHGVDINGDLLKLGEERARDESLNVTFEEGDLNTLSLPADTYDIVFCHASLHHVLELESLVDQVKHTLKPNGTLVVKDVVMRNGSLMWPETKEMVANIWRTLPEDYRINHTAYEQKRVDDEMWDADTSAVGMECIRSEDVVPLLEQHFRPIHSLDCLSLCMRFFHYMYGPNFDLTRPFDAAFFEWVWQLDNALIAQRRLRGELHFGIYTLLTNPTEHQGSAG